jgi:chemotaxis protein MotB
MARKKRKQIGGGTGEWLTTYSDMVTLLLCFFVALFNSSDIDPDKYEQMVQSFANSTMSGFWNGLGQAGSEANAGRLQSGKSVNASLSSPEKGKKYSGPALKKAISEFEPEIKSNKVRVMATEKGIVISLLSNAFFAPTSADLKIDDNRDFLIRLADFLVAENKVDGVHFKVEGHTDSTHVDPEGPWGSNWELSSARAVNTLSYLILLGVSDRRFEVVGLSDTVPIASNESPEGRAYNRRVDVVISFVK